MTVQSIQNNLMFGRSFSTATSSNPTQQSTSVTTSGHKIAPMIQIPKTGNIQSVKATLSSAGSGTVTVTIETIDPTTGNPTGTLVHANATQTISLTATPTVQTITFPGVFAVTRGDYVAVVIQSNSTSTLFYSTNSDNLVTLPCSNVFTGTWAKNASCGASVIFVYDDASEPAIFGAQAPNSGTTLLTLNTGTNPKIYGNLFTPTFNCTMSGLTYIGQINGSYEFRLYDSDGATVLATTSIDYRSIKNGIALLRYFLFTSDITLTKNTAYRIVVVPTSVSDIKPYQYNYASTADLNNSDLGSMLYQTSANTVTPTGNGDWTNTNTNRITIWPVLSGLDDGVSSGGGGGIANKRVGIFGGENYIRVSR